MPPKSYLSAVRPDAPPPSTAPIGKTSSSEAATSSKSSSPPSTSTSTTNKKQQSTSSRSRKQNHSSTHHQDSSTAANTSAKCAHCSYTNFGLYRDPENKRLYCRMCWFDFYAEFPDNDKHRYVGRGCTEHSLNAVEPKWKQVVHDYKQFERYVKMHCAWTHRNEQMQEKLELTRARIHFYPQGHPATIASKNDEEMKNEGERTTMNDDDNDYQYAPISDTYIPYFPISEPGASELDIYSPVAEYEEQDELAKQYKEQQKQKQEGNFYGKPVSSCNAIIEVMHKQDDGTYYLRQKMQDKDPENFGMSNKKNLTKLPPDFLPHSKKKQMEQQQYYDQYYKEHIDQRYFWDENYQMYYYYDEHQQPQWYYGEETAEMRRQRSEPQQENNEHHHTSNNDDEHQQHEEETDPKTENEKNKESDQEQESTTKKFPRLHCDTGVEYSVHIKRLDKKTHKWQFVLLQLIEVDFGTYAVSERKGLIGFRGLCDCHFFDSVSSARHFFHRLFYNKTHNDWLKCSMNFLEFHPVDDFYHLSISNEVEDVKKELHRQEKVREGAPDTYQTFCSYVFDSYKVVDGVATVATAAKSSSSSNQQQQQQQQKASESSAVATNQKEEQQSKDKKSTSESNATKSDQKQNNNKDDDERDSSSSNGHDADTLTEGGEQPSSSKKVKNTKNNNTSTSPPSQKTPEEEQEQKEKIEAEKRLAEEKKKMKQQKHSSSSSGMMEEVMFMGGMAIVGIAAAGMIWFLKNRQTNKN